MDIKNVGEALVQFLRDQKLFDKVVKQKERLTPEQTKLFLNSQFLDYTEHEDGIHLNENLKMSVALGSFPFTGISVIAGSLDLSGSGITAGELKHLPAKIEDDLILTRNKIDRIEHLPLFGGSLDVSGNQRLHSIEGFSQTNINGSFIADSCAFKEFPISEIERVYGDVILTNNKIRYAVSSTVIDGTIDLSSNIITNEPQVNAKTVLISGNPVQPDDEFEVAQW